VGWITYAGLVLLALVLSGYFAFSFFVRSGVTAVPNIEGLPSAEAEARVRDHGLRLDWRQGDERYDAGVPVDHVLLQSPAAGNLVKRGASVEAVRSLGEELVEVPDVLGEALQAAQVTLAASGLRLGGTLGVYRSGGQPGTVVEQRPLPGSRVGAVTPVELYLCLENPSETYLMPDLVYRSYEEVKRFFERRSFRLGSVKFEAYEGIGPGVILRQFPLPGHALRRHDVISLVVTRVEEPT
jgi:serine/threonine-protein kinase